MIPARFNHPGMADRNYGGRSLNYQRLKNRVGLAKVALPALRTVA
jgi:hypothetical protein